MAEPLIGDHAAKDAEANQPPYVMVIKTAEGVGIQSNIKPEFEELALGLLTKAQLMIASGSMRQKPKVSIPSNGHGLGGLLKRMGR